MKKKMKNPINKIILHGHPKCKTCKKRDACNKIIELNKMAEKLQKEFGTNVEICWDKEVAFIGYLGREDNPPPVAFWVEAILNDGHRGLFIPPSGYEYICTELPDEHGISYV